MAVPGLTPMFPTMEVGPVLVTVERFQQVVTSHERPARRRWLWGK